MNCIIRYFKKRQLLSKIRQSMNKIKACRQFHDSSFCYIDDDIRSFLKNEIKENNERMLDYMKQLKELQK